MPGSRSAAQGTEPPSDDAQPLLTCQDVTKRYTRGGGSRSWLPFRSGSTDQLDVTAVESLSLSIQPGEIVGISGPSGSGKSTLLHLLAGLESPTSGTVRFADTELQTLSDRQRTRHRLNHVGIVFQRFHLLPSISARANVALPLLERGVGKRTRRSRAEVLLDDVGLGDRHRHTPDELSGGEQQRVAIARALATDPTLIIADEPTGELDSTTSRQILEVLKAIPETGDRAVVVASHDQQTLASADRVIELVDGRIREEATP